MKMRTPRRFVWVASIAILASIAGCSNDTKGKPQAAGGGPQKMWQLAFVTNNASPFWTIAKAGCQDAVSELGNVKLDFRIPSEGTAASQQRDLDSLVAAGVDGIAVSPIDPAHQTDFLNKIADQTLLICHDSDAPDSKRVCYIGTDNVAAGREAGKLIKEAIPGGGKIMVFVGRLDAQNAKERLQGITEELKGSNVEIIDTRTDENDRVRARKNAEDAMVKYPDIACLVGLWDYNGPAILHAVEGASQTGKVKIVCFDENDDTLDGVAKGAIYGTVVQQPYEFGKQAITKMAKYLGGDKEALGGGKQIVPTRSLKKDDIAEFRENLKKTLGK
jgi:ribose transport system substrate-binding protein